MRRAHLTAASAAVALAALAAAGCASTVSGQASFAGAAPAPTATPPATGSDQPTTAPQTSSAPTTPPSTAAPKTGDPAAAARLRVCAGMTRLVVASNGALNALPGDASLADRQRVAASFSAADRQLIAVLRSAPQLGNHDLVRVRGNEVIKETAKVATLLRSGDPFTDAALIGAQGRLSQACAS